MIYLDNAATTYPKPPAVIRAVNDALRRYAANPGRGGHRMAVASSKLVFDTRMKMKEFFCVEEVERVIFTSGCTASLNTVIKDYCDLALKVYKRYKDRDIEAPFCFLRKPGANSAIRPKYGFEPVDADPLDSGSRYEKMYLSAANALSMHCLEFSQYS